MKAPRAAAAAIVGAVFVIFSLPAAGQGVRLELGLAKSELGNAGDNIWLDRIGYQHQENLHPWGAILGASGDFNRVLGWRVWAVDFGHSSNAADWPSDEDYFAHVHADPIYQGHGHGSAYGLTIAPTVSYRPAQDVQLSAEAGLLIYRATWSEQVQKLDASGQGVGPWFDMPGDWTGAHEGVTPYIGLTARWGPIFASARKYRDIHAYNGVFGNSATQLIAGVSYAF